MKTKLKSIILGTIFSLIHFKSFALGKVEISGYVKLDQVYNPADNLKETSKQTFSDGALLRDAAINFYSPLSENISFNLEFNIAKPGIGTTFIEYSGIKNTSILIGQVPSPFCLATANGSKYISFLEADMGSSAFKPCIGPGTKFSHWSDNWALSFALRQAPYGTSAIGWEKENESRQDYDRFGGSFHFNAAPIHEVGDHVLHLGGSYSFQAIAKTTKFKSNLEFKTREDYNLLETKYIDATNYQVYGPELAYQYGPLHIEAEYLRNSVSSEKEKNPNFSSWYAQANYTIFGGNKSYKLKDGKFGAPQGDKDALQLGGRISHLNLNDKEIEGGEATNYTLSLNYYINSQIKVATNYIYSKSKKNEKERNLGFVALRLQAII
jgi:phosphate-selective porin OprO and OprP